MQTAVFLSGCVAVDVVAVNVAALFFLPSVYAQVALLTVGVGIVVMAVIYSKLGFVRLLGIGHLLWIPMLPWLFFQLPTVDRESSLYLWLVCLPAVNTACLIIDAVDVARFFAGEKSPHYVWHGKRPTVDHADDS